MMPIRIGYVVSLFFGMVDFASIGSAAAFQVPQPLHFGIMFEPSSCIAIAIPVSYTHLDVYKRQPYMPAAGLLKTCSHP